MIATGEIRAGRERARGRPPRVRTGRPVVAVVGPLPPPVHGCSVFTRLLLGSRIAEEFEVVHVDITDPRDVDNIGRFDFGNVRLAARHGAAFARVLVAARPQLVYIPVAQNTWGFMRDALFLTPAALSRSRMVVHFHGEGFGTFRRGVNPVLRMVADGTLRRARAAIVQGEALIPMLDGVVGRDRVRLVPNGVPDAFGRMPGRPASAERRVCVLFLANLSPAKGCLDLVDAATRLLDEGADVEFVFAGGVADAAARAEAALRARPYGERIRFPGVADEARKHALLERADIFALPSHSEAHPLVVLEAMSAGLPVVTTRRGAIPETVVDGETGLLTQPRDTAGLTAALRRLVADPALRARMGVAARNRYLEGYTVERWIDGMIAVFRSVLDE